MALADPVARLRMAPRIARQIYDAERSEIHLLREAGVVISELAVIEQEKECGRYEAQGPTIAPLVQSARLAPASAKKKQGTFFGLSPGAISTECWLSNVNQVPTATRNGWAMPSFPFWSRRSLPRKSDKIALCFERPEFFLGSSEPTQGARMRIVGEGIKRDALFTSAMRPCLDRYVPEEQRSRRPIFIATLRAAPLTSCFVAHGKKHGGMSLFASRIQ